MIEFAKIFLNSIRFGLHSRRNAVCGDGNNCVLTAEFVGSRRLAFRFVLPCSCLAAVETFTCFLINENEFDKSARISRILNVPLELKSKFSNMFDASRESRGQVSSWLHSDSASESVDVTCSLTVIVTVKLQHKDFTQHTQC